MFIYPPSQNLLRGTVIADYWAPSTDNGGLLISHLSASHPFGHDNCAYLLQSGDYMVDCDPCCPGGYLNDPFSPGNCFFQPSPDKPHHLLVVLRVTLLQGQLHELFTNYGPAYRDAAHLATLSPAARARCEAFYSPRGSYHSWLAGG